MDQYVYLVGADDAKAAGHAMQAAADTFRNSVAELDEVLRRDREERRQMQEESRYQPAEGIVFGFDPATGKDWTAYPCQPAEEPMSPDALAISCQPGNKPADEEGE